jgi:hypothetical protein
MYHYFVKIYNRVLPLNCNLPMYMDTVLAEDHKKLKIISVTSGNLVYLWLSTVSVPTSAARSLKRVRYQAA